MLSLILIPAFYIASLAVGLVRAFAPTNIVIRHLRALRPRWSHVGLLFAFGTVLYAPVAVITRDADPSDISWITFPVILLWYDALKLWWHAALTGIRCLAECTRRAVRRGGMQRKMLT